MPIKHIRIATRKSPLALWQAQHVGHLIQQHWPMVSIELIPMLTSGDKFNKEKLQAIGGKGLFVKELEEALFDGRADIAVHSMKDVLAQLPLGLDIVTICKRDNPLDALLSPEAFTLETLPKASIVGTTSLRRQSQLLSLRPDVIIKPLRGNINTRIKKMEDGEFDAILLAAAGMARLGLTVPMTIIDASSMLPSCGQGALGIECRVDQPQLLELLAPLNDHLTSICVRAERRVNLRLGGNCHVPLAVFCTPLENNQLHLSARVLSLDGKTVIAEAESDSVENSMSLADRCVLKLLEKGAGTLLELL
jgi:hydroxymethylbilane synthase